jgi:hypothetical protein
LRVQYAFKAGKGFFNAQRTGCAMHAVYPQRGAPLVGGRLACHGG